MGKESKKSKSDKTAAAVVATSPEKAASKDNEEGGVDYEVRLKGLNAIAHPLAPKKLTKKIYKTVKKGRNLFLFPTTIPFCLFRLVIRAKSYHILLYLCILAAKSKHIKRGVKEVVKGLRKGSKG